MNNYENKFPGENKLEATSGVEEKLETLRPQDIEGDEDLSLKLAEDQLSSEKEANKIQAEISGEKNPEQKRAEAEQRRIEYIQAGFDLIIADLQSLVDRKGISGWVTPKNEIREKIGELNQKKESKPIKVSWEAILTEAVFNGKGIKARLEELKTEHNLTGQDKEAMAPSKQVLEQIKSHPVSLSGPR